MTAPLWVIEAPGKIADIKRIVSSLGYEITVFATKGHFMEMPETLSDLGIDNRLHDYKRQPKDKERITVLRTMAQEAGSVFIATDADSEGDVIAWDVHEALSGLDILISRVRLKGMDVDSVREAIENRDVVCKEDAIPGRTRAILDRMIGSVFSKEGVAVGRVSTALLGLIQAEKPSVKRLTLTALDKNGGAPWVAYTDIKEPLTIAIADALLDITFPAMTMNYENPHVYPPNHMGDIMVRAADSLDLSPQETAQSMQRLYETSRLSYPRSGSRGLSRTAAGKIKSLFSRNHGNFQIRDVVDKTQADTHDAPYPIGTVNTHDNPVRLGADEGVRTLIARDLVKTGQKHKEQTPVLTGMKTFLLNQGFSESVATFVSGLHWHRNHGPAYPGKERWPEAGVTTRRPDGVLLEAALNAGLGRPSTWGKHIGTFLEKGLVDDNLELTQKGHEWIRKSPPELLNPALSAAIERVCENNKNIRVKEGIDKEPWEVLAGKIISSLPASLKEPLIQSVSLIGPQERRPIASFAPENVVDAPADTVDLS